MELERRAVAIEVRAAKDGRTLEGYAAVFNTWTDIGSYFREQVAPGAFAETIAADDIRALFNHDRGALLGRNKAGTLRLSEDSTGLHFAVDLPETTLGNDVRALVERGDLSGASFGFRTITDAWQTVDGKDARTLQKVKLFDVSPVTFPAYDATSVSVREIVDGRREAERRALAVAHEHRRRALEIASAL